MSFAGTLTKWFRRPPAVVPNRKALRSENSPVTDVRLPYITDSLFDMPPERLAAVLRQADSGDNIAWLRFVAAMERRDGHYFSQIGTRKLAVAGLPMHIVSSSERVKRLLNEWIDGPVFRRCVWAALDALSKGVSIQEIVWDTSAKPWLPAEIKWRLPEHFVWRPGDFYTLSPDDTYLPLYKYVIHQPPLLEGPPLGSGLARPCAAMHVFKSLSYRGMMAFSEVYGQPLRIGRHPVNAEPQDVEALRQAVADIGTDAAVVLPENMKIEFERQANSGMPGGDSYHGGLIDVFNKEISKAVIGQTMTAESGGSRAQASVHNVVRLEIRKSDASALRDTLQRDLIDPIVRLNYGERASAELVIETIELPDIRLYSQALIPFMDRGLHVAIDDLRSIFNLKIPGPENETLVGPPPKVDAPGAEGATRDRPPKQKTDPSAVRTDQR